MHSSFQTASFQTTGFKARLSALALGTVFSLGLVTLVVGGMAQQSDGQSLQAFMATQAQQRLLAATDGPVLRHGG